MVNRRSLLLATLVAAAVAMPTVAAAADQAAPQQPVPVTAQGFAVLGPPDDSALLPPERIKVEVTAGRERARAYVRLQLAAATAVAALPLTLHEATDTGSVSLQPDTARLIACLLTGPFVSGAQPAGDVPMQDCSLAVAGVRAADGTWRFNLAPFAAAWRTGTANYGVAIRTPVPATTDSWRVVFDTVRTAAVAVSSPVTPRPGWVGPAPGASSAPFGSPVPPSLPTPASTTGLPLLPIASQRGAAPPPVTAAASDGRQRSPAAHAPVADAAGNGTELPLRLPLVALVLVPAGAAVLASAAPSLPRARRTQGAA